VSVTVYIPQDSGALSMGANSVVAAVEKEAQKRGQQIQIVRNGSRGMYWLEPLVEVATANGRVAYGPVSARDVTGLFDAGFLEGGKHGLSLGLTEEIP
jgi:formate dehydrogenase iron-sulfur subunit